ncbi:hypothetical protein EBB05_08230 [Methylobacterium brachiatum]|nr:hypothetical protein EBB05_08230 [Methylobacterium brachiatum]
MPSDRRSFGLEGAFQRSPRPLEGSFEASAMRKHLRMRPRVGKTRVGTLSTDRSSHLMPGKHCLSGFVVRAS